MLSPVIKKLLENKLGKDIRYSSDIEHLSFDIEKHTNQRIGVNTIKRLLGLIEGIKEPRLYTLDTIARYLDFKNWDEMLDSLDERGNSDFSTIEEIDIQALKTGDKIRFTYSPDRVVSIEYIGNNRFIVIGSENSKLLLNDTIEVNHFVLNYPLIITNVIRNDVSMGKFTAGKISGITSLFIL
ncbi:hypothetical protein M2451_000544 [Dysgonomonas sp. PFB1-18]|uniref:hypothetical protein n=1 Tax=unclassified Dysgonomonas TaxID=2630389 RepID=UPI002474B370|nr:MULTISPECIES: hypothetical protein [unclassified Dysgonomonas]MDH6307395.1 hypothetical protein [Dysgonomonas sp. PF1-14]MDH6337313.1 hypothetical protein [Dysgonomonas sp. PF1-16]MDH6379237.1 hypothetical protein [Dysgonomonas sp. PFB1-18]MDH6396125.1 hypothetical protein [Dysgonomonas sp. PF1-23]